MKLGNTTLLASALFALVATAQTASAIGQAPDDEYSPFIKASTEVDRDVKDKKVLFLLQSKDSADVADGYFDVSGKK